MRDSSNSKIDSVLGLSPANEQGQSVDGVRPLKRSGICYQCAQGKHDNCYGDGRHITCDCDVCLRARTGKLRSVKTPEESAKSTCETPDSNG